MRFNTAKYKAKYKKIYHVLSGGTRLCMLESVGSSTWMSDIVCHIVIIIVLLNTRLKILTIQSNIELHF